MKKVIYMIKRIFNMNFLNLFKTASRVSKKSGKKYLFILFDIIYCGFKYMAGYVDYEVFCFYELNTKQRKTIITRGINNKFVNTLNGQNFTDIIDHKIIFHERYDSYLNRKWLDLTKSSFDDFSEFLKSNKTIIAKPVDLCCGKNVEKICYDDSLNLQELYSRLLENKQILIEEYVIQHPDMSKLYPLSVNTLRIVSIFRNDTVHIVFRAVRMGNSGNVVDNFNHGGLFTTVDKDGVIRKPAVDKLGNVYHKHPYTNIDIVNYKIPLFNESIEYVKQLAKVTPQVRIYWLGYSHN